ncbi:MAG: DUF6265 family protein [Steroidobacteraceae bacterium]
MPRPSLLAIIALAASSVSADVPPTGLERLAWLSGCWGTSDANRVSQEQWMRPLGGNMIGMSRTVVGGIAVSHEFMRIEEAGGQLRFVIQPPAQPEAAFTLVEMLEGAVVFGNGTQEYPQRVRYALQPDGSLLGQVEGVVKGRRRVEDFPYSRVPCDGPATRSAHREVKP